MFAIPYPLTDEIEILEPEPLPVFQVIEPAILSYSDAMQIREYAEARADPYFYRMAAMAFDSLDMPNAAQQCRIRAKHYEALS
jgi:hypothetical protein